MKLHHLTVEQALAGLHTRPEVPSGAGRASSDPTVSEKRVGEPPRRVYAAVNRHADGRRLPVPRSHEPPPFARKSPQDRMPLGGPAAEPSPIPAIVYTPLGNLLFGAAPLPPAVWALATVFAVAMFLLEEARKRLLGRRTYRPLNHRQQARPTSAGEGVEK